MARPTASLSRASLSAKLNGKASDDLSLGIRPEGVLVRKDAAEGYLPVEASIIEPLGSHDIVDLKVGDHMLRARTKAGYVAKPGDEGVCPHRPLARAFLRRCKRQVAGEAVQARSYSRSSVDKSSVTGIVRRRITNDERR